MLRGNPPPQHPFFSFSFYLLFPSLFKKNLKISGGGFEPPAPPLKYALVSGSALQLITSCFSGRTQRVVIDGILSDFANLEASRFCFGAILKKHNIGYHIYADDTQLYISFNSKEHLTSLTKLNNCISDIRVWMIKNKLKTRCTRGDARSFFCTFKTYLYAQNEISYEYYSNIVLKTILNCMNLQIATKLIMMYNL